MSNTLKVDDNYSIDLTANWSPENPVPFMEESPDWSIKFCREPIGQNEKDLKLRILARAFASLFSGSSEAHYVRDKYGEYSTVKGALTLNRVEGKVLKIGDIERLLSGTAPSILSIPIRKDGHAFFGSIDADRHGDGDVSVDHVGLARQVTALSLPLVVCKSKNPKSAHLNIFLKDSTGYSAAKVQQLLKCFQAKLGIMGEVEIFPKQIAFKEGKDGEADQIGNGLNLPYFGDSRIGFGKKGEELILEEFVLLAQERRCFGDLLMRDWLPDANLSPEAPQPETRKKVLFPTPLSSRWLARRYVILRESPRENGMTNSIRRPTPLRLHLLLVSSRTRRRMS
jgi:hypothetical protein